VAEDISGFIGETPSSTIRTMGEKLPWVRSFFAVTRFYSHTGDSIPDSGYHRPSRSSIQPNPCTGGGPEQPQIVITAPPEAVPHNGAVSILLRVFCPQGVAHGARLIVV